MSSPELLGVIILISIIIYVNIWVNYTHKSYMHPENHTIIIYVS